MGVTLPTGGFFIDGFCTWENPRLDFTDIHPIELLP